MNKLPLSTLLKAQWDRTIAVVCIAVAVVMLIVGYLGISDTPYVAEQLPYFISAGAGAVVLCAVAGMMWVSADLRDEWRKLDRLEAALRDLGVKNMTISAEPIDDRSEARRVTFTDEPLAAHSREAGDEQFAAYSAKAR